MATPENIVTTADARAQTPPAPAAKKKPKAGERVRKGKPMVTEAELAASPMQNVIVRITKKGHGEVHDGEGGRYDAGDEVVLPLNVARALEGTGRDALGYAEIIGRAE